MQYRIIRTGEEPDSFEHALFGGGRQKGAQNKNHKYLARAWWKNKWRYAYTEAEVRALQMLGKAKQTANDVKEKAQSTAEKAKSVATGQYSKDVEKKASTAKQNIARASEEKSKAQSQAKAASVRQDKYSGGLYPAFKGGKEKATNAANSKARAEQNAANAEKARQKYQAELASAARERESTAYKVSEGINKAKNKASETAEKVSNAAKSAKDKGKAKAEEILNNLKKPEQPKEDKKPTGIHTSHDELYEHVPTTWVHTKENSEVTRGRKYEGTGHKAEARKEEGGVAGGPVSGNTNMQGRGEEKKTSLKEKASDLAKKASNVADAVKLGAHLTKKNVENYLNDDNDKVATDTAGKSTLKGQKVTTSYSEGDSLLSKSTLTKKKNADGTVEYEHHTEYGKIAQTAKKGKEAVENLFGDKKTPKYSISTNKLEEYTPPWLEGYHFKNGKMEVDKSVAETFEKGKSKAKEVLNKVSSAAKATAAKAYDKVTDDIEKVRESDAVATIGNAANKVKDKVSDAKEAVYDKAVDTAASAKHVAEATKARVQYGSDSLQYKEAKAHVDYDKAIDDLAKARKKYGVNTVQYKQAAAAESKAREQWQDAREQNLYKNNKEYRTYSDRASYLGSYLDNWDKRGGPQTAEGKANYQKMMNELRGLESKIDAMKRG